MLNKGKVIIMKSLTSWTGDGFKEQNRYIYLCSSFRPEVKRPWYFITVQWLAVPLIPSLDTTQPPAPLHHDDNALPTSWFCPCTYLPNSYPPGGKLPFHPLKRRWRGTFPVFTLLKAPVLAHGIWLAGLNYLARTSLLSIRGPLGIAWIEVGVLTVSRIRNINDWIMIADVLCKICESRSRGLLPRWLERALISLCFLDDQHRATYPPWGCASLSWSQIQTLLCVDFWRTWCLLCPYWWRASKRLYSWSCSWI